MIVVDLKAAFDSVDRRELVRAMKERGIKERLILMVEKILTESKSRIRVGKKVREEFWTTRGVRQECPLNPMLFNIMIANVEKVMKKIKWGEVKLGEKNLHLGLCR